MLQVYFFVGFYINDLTTKPNFFLRKVLYMIGKQWRKMDFHGGYVASEELKIYMMNSE